MATAFEPDQTSRDPYCGECGYVLTGLTDSARCPECGRPVIDVLVRPGFTAPRGKRYRSRAMMFGLPVIDIALGPSGSEATGRARGIIAIGDDAMGWLAIGGMARGIVAIGGFAMGVFSMGGAAIGIGTALGGAALGGLAAGGAAAGGLAQGGGAVGIVAQGGGAIGWAASGGGVWGVHTIGPAGPSSQRAQDIFDGLTWFFGSSTPTTMSMIQPMALLMIGTIGMAALIGVIALMGIRSERERPQSLDIP